MGIQDTLQQKACQHAAGMLDLVVTVEVGSQAMSLMLQVVEAARMHVQGPCQPVTKRHHQKHLTAFLESDGMDHGAET